MILLPCMFGVGPHDGQRALPSASIIKRLGILKAFARSLNG